MKILIEKPPIYDAIISAGMNPHKGVIYTYGETIYNPSGIELREDVIKHEKFHMRQQGDDPEGWWSRYLDDQYFRIEQEAEAYARQYDFICKNLKDRNFRARVLVQMADSLSSPIYGSVITEQSAMSIIKSNVRTK